MFGAVGGIGAEFFADRELDADVPSGMFMLLETADYILLEGGGRIMLES